VVYEDLRVSNMVKNHCLAKSISDASWHQFRVFLEYFGKVFGRITIAVNPAYTVKNVVIVGKSLKNLYPPEPIFVNVDARWIEIVMPQLIS
jgi:putative transposase